MRDQLKNSKKIAHLEAKLNAFIARTPQSIEASTENSPSVSRKSSFDNGLGLFQTEKQHGKIADKASVTKTIAERTNVKSA